MVTKVLAEITSWVQGFISVVVDAVEGMIPLFYTAENGITILGSLALMGLGIGIVRLGINFVKSFFLR